ncbi:NADH pyrophosphatase [Cordyceps fumosorosea ARSEF 2679]|uniref:NAD(+) diphosphatase n=1 Tax=Cordyceps fumosorosea (strain ARSEF 2679) TaxID=1081104 RepID=A0A167RN34_CORFA|nr:NADH pyrophosphatase [Cordyceps fumosorosea ARSEF 2679]OAA58758.1 NADH pyrophosphatase [Cordyceps fumosorosea ARSEF 2679]
MPSPPVKVMLPSNPALQADDCMLTRKFGQEVINYYSGTRLNRYSFLRTDAGFLRRAALAPAARYVALSDLSAVAVDKSQLATFRFEDVKPLIGADPAIALEEKAAVAQFDSTRTTPLVVFLGLVDGSIGGAAAAEEEQETVEIQSATHGTVKAQPYFAVDITPRDPYKEAAEAFQKTFQARGLSIETNPRALTLLPEHASIYAQARSMIDWNTRNRFCAGCGSRNLSIQAGYKRACPPADLRGGNPLTRDDCPTRHGVSNVCFPRTDPTMIAAVLSADGRRVLLGRQAAWPADWYSTLAGFLEPGESMEETVRREVWEESGVRVGRVVIHSTQPWPYPSSLMIGAVAQALPGGEEVTLHDKELESARWFTLDEVRVALAQGGSALGAAPPPEYKPGDLRVPPPQAIAHQLMAAVVEGKFTGASKI